MSSAQLAKVCSCLQWHSYRLYLQTCLPEQASPRGRSPPVDLCSLVHLIPWPSNSSLWLADCTGHQSEMRCAAPQVLHLCRKSQVVRGGHQHTLKSCSPEQPCPPHALGPQARICSEQEASTTTTHSAAPRLLSPCCWSLRSLGCLMPWPSSLHASALAGVPSAASAAGPASPPSAGNRSRCINTTAAAAVYLLMANAAGTALPSPGANR